MGKCLHQWIKEGVILATVRRLAPELELEVAAATSVALFGNFLSTLVPFKRFGVLIITIVHMLSGDIFHFLVGAVVPMRKVSARVSARSEFQFECTIRISIFRLRILVEFVRFLNLPCYKV
jgi:hypothetical protein